MYVARPFYLVCNGKKSLFVSLELTNSHEFAQSYYTCDISILDLFNLQYKSKLLCKFIKCIKKIEKTNKMNHIFTQISLIFEFALLPHLLLNLHHEIIIVNKENLYLMKKKAPVHKNVLIFF